MIRIAKESDLPAVAAVYEAILDHEDATGLHYTGWKRGAYPTAETARSIFNAGTLYVGVDEDVPLRTRSHAFARTFAGSVSR